MVFGPGGLETPNTLTVVIFIPQKKINSPKGNTCTKNNACKLILLQVYGPKSQYRISMR